MNLVEIQVELPSGTAGEVDQVLQELGSLEWNVFEDVVVGKAWLKGVFSDDDAARDAWRRLIPTLPREPQAWPQPALHVLRTSDWRESYRTHFKPWKFGRLHWVPVWERDTYRVGEGEAVLWLDPGMAFGTGNHETTRLVVERLVEWHREPLLGRTQSALRVLDAGCGSGILALSAAKLGITQVRGFDNDPEAVRVSRENAALNGLAGIVAFQTEDLQTGLAGGLADLVMANIQADVLVRFAPELLRAVAPAGSLVLSGILRSEVGSVFDAFRKYRPDWHGDSRVLGEWSDIVLTRTDD